MKQLLIILCIFASARTFGQENPASSSTADSTQYKLIQHQLDGCWRNKYHQFKYKASSNSGGDYKSRTHSSAPVFRLILKDNNTYLAWIELTGGENLQRVQKISKNKLVVVNESGMRVVYRRNKKAQ